MAVVAAAFSWAWPRPRLSPRNRAANGIGSTRGTLTTERLALVEVAGGVALAAKLDEVDEDLPGFSWNSTTGVFSGRPVTSTWECPDWFPSSVCDNVVAVYTGPQTYNPFDDRPFQVRADYVVTEIDDQAVLYQSWVDVFACPWFRAWDEALAADPSCAFAP